jgi:hypothetical protein
MVLAHVVVAMKSSKARSATANLFILVPFVKNLVSSCAQTRGRAQAHASERVKIFKASPAVKRRNLAEEHNARINPPAINCIVRQVLDESLADSGRIE